MTETTENILSQAIIRVPVILYGSVQVTKPETGDLYAEAIVDNPIPSAPTSLVATDAGLGDAINLSWVSTASYFNVYKKVGAVYTKLNPNVLTEGTSYLVGGLTAGVAVGFVVRAANGLGQESSNSNIATATPTLADTASRFTNPAYEIYISGVLWPTAILSSVELGFGSELSTASFVLPNDPRGVVPGNDEPVEVFINSRKVFKGYTSIKNDSIDSGGLQVNYVCHSTIIDLTKTTLYSTDVHAVSTVFNAIETPPDGLPFTRNYRNAAAMLSAWGITGGPNEYPGHVDVTDQTRLAAAELVLSRLGNYRLYHDMNTEITSVYNFGSNGTTIREFQFAKNIVSYKIDDSSIDVIKSVTVIGAPTAMRNSLTVDAKPNVDPDGRLALSFDVYGTNIRDIQVYGIQKAKPNATFDDEIQVTLDDFEGPGETSDEFNASWKSEFFGWQDPATGLLNNSNEKQMYPNLVRLEESHSTWTALGAKIAYNGMDHATIYLNECPKIWKAVIKTGNVKRATVGQKSTNPSDTLSVQILRGYDFQIGTIKVACTTDSAPPVVTVGSGLPARTITDTQYSIVNDLGLSFGAVRTSGSLAVRGSNNSVYIIARMQARALAELAQHNVATLGGTITVVGDETIDLRSAVRVNGQLLEVSHVSHSFQNGYTTTVTLTNEPFVKQIVFYPFVSVTNQSKTNERTHKGVWYEWQLASMTKFKAELASQKDTIDKQAPSSGKYAVYQD